MTQTSTSPAGEVGEMIERLEAHMGRADLQDVLADCRAAASMLRRLAASDTEATGECICPKCGIRHGLSNTSGGF